MSRFGRSLELTINRSGLAWMIRQTVARRQVSILVYHDPDPSTFRRHLRFLAKRYSFVRLDDVIAAMQEDRWEDLPSHPLVITFDDGLKGNRALAALCREYSCPVTVYVCSQLVNTRRHLWVTEARDSEPLKALPTAERLERIGKDRFDLLREFPEASRQALSREEMETMADVADFGSHTRLHPILTVCDDEEARREISESKVEVEQITGRACEHFAYPNGDYMSRELEYVESAGYTSARSIDTGWNGKTSNRFRLRVLGTRDDASIDRLAADLAGAGFIWRWRLTRRWDGKKKTILRSKQGVLGAEPEALGQE